jgi:hypothetical protein
MRRRDFSRLMAASAGLGLLFPARSGLGLLSSTPLNRSLEEEATPWPANANYRNNRLPLLPTKYIKFRLGTVRPTGWLLDQLKVQANGLTSHLPTVWGVIADSGWKGDAGRNVTPECCTPRFVPRWLEGLTALASVLDDNRLKSLADPYMQYILAVKDLTTVTPSAIAWLHLGRFLPDYYEVTGDVRAIGLARRILDYADSVRNSSDGAVVDPGRLGMLLSFGWWYYNRSGDRDVLALMERCTKRCVEDWKNFFVHFPEDPKYFAHFPDVTAEKSREEPPSEWSRHGVNVTQAIQYPILYSLMSKDGSESDSVLHGLANLDRGYGQVGARWNADEWLAGTDPTQGTELCDVEELLYSLEKSFEAIGEMDFADRIEQLMFNAFPGTCTADMWAHQYDQQANQVLVSVAKRPWHLNDDTSNIYGFSPNFPCCLANMHSPWPRYVQSMWMATADNGVVAALYGPCRVQAKVGDGATIEIIEETDYPFSDRVRMTIHSDRPAAFPLYFRIPSWAGRAALSISGEPRPRDPQRGTCFKVERVWKPGDVVTLFFDFKVRTETRRSNAVAIAWGPLYFVLRIGESFEKIPVLAGAPTPPGCVNWRVAPTTAWNYALAIDRHHPHCIMTTNRIGAMPFAQKGEPVKLPGADEFTPWQQDVPIVLKVKARRLPEWGMNGANAAAVPVSPVNTNSPETLVELIPYGCSRLRISEFPTVG